MDEIFQVGSFAFRVLCPDSIQPPRNLRLFHSPVNQVDYTYQIRVERQHSAPEGTIVAQRPDVVVFQTPIGENRLLRFAGSNGFYAFYRESGPDRAEIMISPSCLEFLNYDTVFLSLLALERRMIVRDSLVLHCSYSRYRGKAILFSAPSETGKSTQSDLWTKCRGAETINGDRSLLCKTDGRWNAAGWPVCGSSEICHNCSTPIHAIVMLSQAEENQVHRLSGMDAFRQLFSQITVNRWNPEYVQRAMDLLNALCCDVPVWHLGCTISEEAVRCLEQALF
ncbi:MAG: hypothetical protein ACI3VN_03585 [Candidatus Onthomonas sp.]